MSHCIGHTNVEIANIASLVSFSAASNQLQGQSQLFRNTEVKSPSLPRYCVNCYVFCSLYFPELKSECGFQIVSTLP